MIDQVKCGNNLKCGNNFETKAQQNEHQEGKSDSPDKLHPPRTSVISS